MTTCEKTLSAHGIVNLYLMGEPDRRQIQYCDIRYHPREKCLSSARRWRYPYANWIGAWLDIAAAKRTKSGQPQRFEWGLANERYRLLILKLIAKPTHFIITGQPTTVYTTQGQETGLKRARWQKQTPHWVDIVLSLDKVFIKQSKVWKYMATVQKCRFNRAYEASIEDVTYDRLLGKLTKDLGVKF